MVALPLAQAWALSEMAGGTWSYSRQLWRIYHRHFAGNVTNSTHRNDKSRKANCGMEPFHTAVVGK
jgi:hypothetical protein